ncbi:MAG: metallophosphoesterase [Thermoguttaceae bacterium]|nr:metallophosphoesterase [Thermoguttaceae bacterium]
MKRFAIFILLAFSLFIPAPSARSQETDYQPPALVEPDGWTMVIIPDPQTYARFTRNQGIFDLMTSWIAENRGQLNIQQVVCVGDLVEMNGLKEADGTFANQNGRQMWSATSRGFERLDGIYPYILCTGNHDYGPEMNLDEPTGRVRSSETRETHFAEYFPIGRNPALEGVLVETAPNAFGVHTLENAAYEWTAPGGKKILAVALEFVPRDEVIEWAKELFARPEYRDHFGIVATHSYLLGYNRDLEHTPREAYILSDTGNSGQQIWEKLVKPAANIRMVLCGHIAEPDNMDASTGFRVDLNDSGKPVYQILFDTQAMGGGWHGNGGDGWLQLLEFDPDLTRVHVRTFSPLMAISPSTRGKAWYRDERRQFDFEIE